MRSEFVRERTWVDGEHLQVGKGSFFLSTDPGVFGALASEIDRFMLLKQRSMIESLVDQAPDRVENIFDLGIYKGGSVVLYHELFQPNRLVGIELSHYRVRALDEFIHLHSLDEVIHLYYGTLQNDQDRLRNIVRDEFGDEPLDLVVDDCSHRYGHTKRSMNVLLPRLRPGGLYVIEDWGWAHWPGDRFQGRKSQYAKERWPLSRLILELVMVAASRPGLVKRVDVTDGTVYVTRGTDIVTDPDFDISRCYLTSRRTMLSRIPRTSLPTTQQWRNLYHHVRRTHPTGRPSRR
ncbi:MAG: class I SAM-dependent methyltransferase [Acidimicrobiales bacterium]